MNLENLLFTAVFMHGVDALLIDICVRVHQVGTCSFLSLAIHRNRHIKLNSSSCSVHFGNENFLTTIERVEQLSGENMNLGNVNKCRECVSTGAAGARTRRSLGHHLLHPLILRF